MIISRKWRILLGIILLFLEWSPSYFDRYRSYAEGIWSTYAYQYSNEETNETKYIGIWYFDSAGNLLAPYRYPEGRDFSEGIAAVMRDGKWGVFLYKK